MMSALFRRTGAAIACSALLFLGFTPVFAQDDVLVIKEQPEKQPGVILPSSPSDLPADSIFLQFYDKWQDVQDAVKQGNTTDAETILQQVVDIRRKTDIPRMTDFAMNAVQMGDDLLSAQKTDSALKFYSAATVLDPSLSYAYYSESKAHLSRGFSGYFPAITSAIQGLLAPESTLTGQMYFRSKWLFILLATGVALSFVFALVILIKYNRLLRHDAVEKYGSKSHALVECVVWAILFLPVMFLFGPLWLAPFWLMLLWGYCRPQEKVIAILCFVVFLFAAPAYYHVAELSQATSDPSVVPYLRAFSEGGSPRVIQDFKDYTAQHPEDQDGGILLAYLLKSETNYQAAGQLLQKFTVDHPSDARAFNNLANVFFIQGETDTALRFLEKAKEIDGRNATILFNLSKGYRSKFDFTQAESLLEQARATDGPLVRRLEGGSTDQLVDIIPREDVLWSKIESKEKPFSRLIVNPFTILTLALLAGAFVIYSGKRSKGYAHKCLKCGKPFCNKCQTGSKSYEFCTQCLHIFVKKDGVSPASRKEKMHEIEKHSVRQKWYLRLFSLFVPGTGNLLGRHTVSGVVVLFFWLLFVVLLVFDTHFAFLSFFEPGEKTKALTLFYVLSMVVVYAIANIPLFLKSQKA